MAAPGLRTKRKHHDNDFSSISHSCASDSDGEACNHRRRHRKKNASLEPNQMRLRIGLEDSAHDHFPYSKVCSISTSNENKEVNITRSDEVPGKSSADGTAASVADKSGNLSLGALKRAKRALQMKKQAQELAAKMGCHQDPGFAPLINMFPRQMPRELSIRQKPPKAPVLHLDAHGREVDEQRNVINQPKLTNLSTLKVNINKQKKEAFQILKPELELDPESNPHYDQRMGINKAKLLRPKRIDFQFVEQGAWSKQAEIAKFKNQFGAGPDINPNLIEVSDRVIIKEKPKDPIPEVEWWDAVLLPSGTYGDIGRGSIKNDKLKMEKITIYVEHPLSAEPPAEPAPPPPQSFKLTKKEQKKLSTENRLAKEKDRQEMISQGLLEPPKSKVKMGNLMQVLGSEATQDPTRLEMKIRSEAAEREQAHIDRNIARKLTPAERREKKMKKRFDNPNELEKIVSRNLLTGCLVITEDLTVVVVEGGNKSIKRYGKLMFKKINGAETVRNEEEDSMAEDDDKPVTKCVLVWQGNVAKSSFNSFAVHQCRTEASARKCFADAGVGHYWDISVNTKDDP
ncbi:hypothetical protein MKW98_019569 [Papaver atlanticum]|uniref:Uncharacterized protein n=1 Tax=Papaver atlanticum TaxID=357466 RepID=A0AAD4SB73_9MAGN|nr:hypothetical protein MKW98_019569 [Papaver atlanticum]